MFVKISFYNLKYLDISKYSPLLVFNANSIVHYSCTSMGHESHGTTNRASNSCTEILSSNTKQDDVNFCLYNNYYYACSINGKLII